MFAEVDTDQSGEIDFDEFVAVMSVRMDSTYTSQDILRAFRSFEGIDCPGFIRADDLIRAITTYSSEHISPALARELVSQLEVDENGMIDYKPFLETVLRT
jgi:calmodulin